VKLITLIGYTMMVTGFAVMLAGAPQKTLTASWYGKAYDGRPTASGEIFDSKKLTCASWDYPLGTKLKISRGKTSIVVKVNDRGPAKHLLKTRQIDLSQAAFHKLGPLTKGLIMVQVEVMP
tara:strand:- start:41 stop:403 length:363 start_codon:yes stop_codon:yes gene_type:complete